MKTVSNALKLHLQGELTTTCQILRLARTDGTVQGFTNNVLDIVYDNGAGSVTYAAGTLSDGSAIANNSDLSVDNLNIDGLIDSDVISEDDLRAGVYDFAELHFMLVNYEDLTQGHVTLRRGHLGEVSLRSGLFTAEVRGLAQALQNGFIEVFTPDCRYDLGDSRCKVILANFTESGVVASILTARRVFTVSFAGSPTPTPATGYFNGGLLTWTSGDNDGRSFEVKEHSGSTFTLFLPTGKTIQVGDTFSVSTGCDKTADACKAKFDNLLNFGGFRDVPGLDAILKTPNAT